MSEQMNKQIDDKLGKYKQYLELKKTSMSTRLSRLQDSARNEVTSIKEIDQAIDNCKTLLQEQQNMSEDPKLRIEFNPADITQLENIIGKLEVPEDSLCQVWFTFTKSACWSIHSTALTC